MVSLKELVRVECLCCFFSRLSLYSSTAFLRADSIGLGPEYRGGGVPAPQNEMNGHKSFTIVTSGVKRLLESI